MKTFLCFQRSHSNFSSTRNFRHILYEPMFRKYHKAVRICTKVVQRWELSAVVANSVNSVAHKYEFSNLKRILSDQDQCPQYMRNKHELTCVKISVSNYGDAQEVNMYPYIVIRIFRMTIFSTNSIIFEIGQVFEGVVCLMPDNSTVNICF